MDLESIRRTRFFSGLPDSLIERLLENADYLTLESGDVLIAEGSLPDGFYVVLDGDFEILKLSAGQNVPVSISGSGEILGEMSLIENVPRSFTVRAMRRSTVLKIDMDLFNDMLAGSPATALALISTVMRRLRVAESMLRQQEKLASLGTLAAGLAHELNNPAAATKRGAGQLRQAINAWLQARSGLDALHLEPQALELVISRLRQDIEHEIHPISLEDPLARSDRETSIQDWLEEQGMQEAWEFAPLLAAFGWDVPALQAWCEPFNPAHVPVILCWLATGYNIHNLLDEISDSTQRISEIVAAVKNYTYLDQAPQKEIDIHEGLENTLVMLKHKLRQGISVLREYDRTLPRIEAYAGELNQLWTNLIDNAIDAMQGKGQLRLRTYQEKECVVVEIGDNGPGIPEQVLPRLFEPFFTTKAPGSGTGLGLHVSHGIVQKHRGKIEVRSAPGDTSFKVSLPIKVA